MKVLTIDSKTLKCLGYRKVKLCIDHAQSLRIEALIVDEQLLRFDLLLGIDAIKGRGAHHRIS